MATRSGSPRFFELLEELGDTHERKNAGYSGIGNPDPYANFRTSERIGIPAWKGALVRASDKWERIINLVDNPYSDKVDEALEDTLIDLAAYCLIIIDLREQRDV